MTPAFIHNTRLKPYENPKHVRYSLGATSDNDPINTQKTPFPRYSLGATSNYDPINTQKTPGLERVPGKHRNRTQNAAWVFAHYTITY